MGSESINDIEGDPDTVMALLYFIDPKSLFKAFLNSNAAAKIYKSIAHFINNPIELHYTLY